MKNGHNNPEPAQTWRGGNQESPLGESAARLKLSPSQRAALNSRGIMLVAIVWMVNESWILDRIGPAKNTAA